MTQQLSKRPVWILIALALFASLVLLFVYTVLHEGGHALVGLLSGGTIETFNVSFLDFSAHVSMRGGSDSPAVRVLNNLAGMALPLLAWVAFLLLAPRRGNLLLEWVKAVGSMGVFNTLLVWIIFPIIALFGEAPAGEDATRFLRNSGVHPLLMAAFFLLLYLALWMLFLRRIQPFAEWIRRFTEAPAAEWKSRAVWRTAAVMAAVMVAAGVVTLLANLPNLGRQPGQPPAGFTLTQQLDLAENRESAAEAAFTITEEKKVGVFLRLQAVNSPYFDARLRGPDGFEAPLLHGEGYSTFLDTVFYEETLPPGAYQLLLTTRASSGKMDIFLKQ
jgi:hypothetical protein